MTSPWLSQTISLKKMPMKICFFLIQENAHEDLIFLIEEDGKDADKDLFFYIFFANSFWFQITFLLF
jgi:hypothetical protein